jgi:hypothetical protein
MAAQRPTRRRQLQKAADRLSEDPRGRAWHARFTAVSSLWNSFCCAACATQSVCESASVASVAAYGIVYKPDRPRARRRVELRRTATKRGCR